MRALFFSALMLLTPAVFADCSTDQTICEAKCSVKHFTDDAAELGCKSKCVAQRAMCSTESGAKTVVEKGGEVIEDGVEVSKDVIDDGVEISKEAWEDTKSFVKGMTE
ncbi:hypothetical protein ACMXYR_11915 [Neptuniibacter sp. QD29_5]|uniref:hypothetical protein n=1 Tax=unclassified Neptuniibacter TaxID=2630693 RepID=UPI0039F592EC